MKHLTMSMTLVATLALGYSALANPGQAPTGSAIAEYDWLTGEIVVSVEEVNNWFIQSSSNQLRGDATVGLPASDRLRSRDNSILGETGFDTFSYTDVALGNVAASGLYLDDLTVSSNAGLGQPTLTFSVSYLNAPSNFVPTANINDLLGINTAIDPFSLLLDASGSFDDGTLGPLNYRWDLDNDGLFEVSTGTNPTYEIADVTSLFDGLGTFPIAVEVFDGEFSDIAFTTVELEYVEPVLEEPEPDEVPTQEVPIYQLIAAIHETANEQIPISPIDLTNTTVLRLRNGPLNLTGGTVFLDLGEIDLLPISAYVLELTDVIIPYYAISFDTTTSLGASSLSLVRMSGAAITASAPVVPEPASLTLALVGLCVSLVWSRRDV